MPQRLVQSTHTQRCSGEQVELSVCVPKGPAEDPSKEAFPDWLSSNPPYWL